MWKMSTYVCEYVISEKWYILRFIVLYGNDQNRIYVMVGALIQMACVSKQFIDFNKRVKKRTNIFL